jgi:uncharacterized protein (TIGR03118 family)
LVVLEPIESRTLLSAVNSYTQTNLVSDGAVTAATTDPNLVNPWGVAIGPTGPFWVGDNGMSVSTAYIGSTIVPPTVHIPAGSASDASAPTGVVFNNTGGFNIGTGKARHKATYLFASEDGVISAWNPKTDFNNALIGVDNSASGAIYKGLTIGSLRGRPAVYAANFASGNVDVFDKDFNPVTLTGAFADPNLPTGYAPFNIANIHGKLFVSFAQQAGGGSPDEVDGAGLGFVDEFTTAGKLITRFASQGALNAPWAMVQAPGNFGKFSGEILIGNFGDGSINAFKASDGTFEGQLHDTNDAVITIDGLWGLAFGNGSTSKRTTLYFAAGTNDEADGLFGSLTASKTSNPGGGGFQYP